MSFKGNAEIINICFEMLVLVWFVLPVCMEQICFWPGFNLFLMVSFMKMTNKQKQGGDLVLAL